MSTWIVAVAPRSDSGVAGAVQLVVPAADLLLSLRAEPASCSGEIVGDPGQGFLDGGSVGQAAAGQALQNANLMLGVCEHEGLSR